MINFLYFSPSQDLKTGLQLDSSPCSKLSAPMSLSPLPGHTIPSLDWSRVITWPGYWPLICHWPYYTYIFISQLTHNLVFNLSVNNNCWSSPSPNIRRTPEQSGPVSGLRDGDEYLVFKCKNVFNFGYLECQNSLQPILQPIVNLLSTNCQSIVNSATNSKNLTTNNGRNFRSLKSC